MQRKICLSTSQSFDLPEAEQLDEFKRAGFDGFFTMYGSDEHIAEMRRLADEKGLFFQSIHAEYSGAADLWREGEKGEAVALNLIDTVVSAARYGVPVVVTHAYIGFYTGEKPTAVGLERFGRIVEEAEKRGVFVAVENTEGEEFLHAILDEYKSENVGFCWDTGHELCYQTRASVEKYNGRLLATHVNDNLGVRGEDGKITFHDDLHLLPFDGIADWKRNAELLRGFGGPLTAELKRCDYPDSPEHDYRAMELGDYLAEAYSRLTKIAAMIDGR